MTDKEAHNLSVVKKIYETAKRTDNWLPELLDDIHPEIVAHEAEGLPYGGMYHGVPGFERLLKLMYATWDDMFFQPIEFLTGGDCVICYVELSGVGRKTGLSFSTPLAELYRFKDGKVIEFRPMYYDTKRCAEVFGA